MDEFPANSRNVQPPAVPETDKPKVVPTIQGDVIRKKKPLGRRFVDTFFGATLSSTVEYILKDVLVPALQNAAIDMVTKGIHKAVHGDAPMPQNSARPPFTTAPGRPIISYNTPSTARPSAAVNTFQAARQPVTQPNSMDIGQIILAHQIDVDFVLEKMSETLQEYGMVSVGDLFGWIKQTASVTDFKYGWTDLSGTHVRRVSEGYLLVLPVPINIK